MDRRSWLWKAMMAVPLVAVGGLALANSEKRGCCEACSCATCADGCACDEQCNCPDCGCCAPTQQA